MKTKSKNNVYKNGAIEHQVKQRGPEWFKLRLGRFTSSDIFKLMTEPRSKAAKEAGELSETAKSYILEKAAEILYNSPAPFFSNSAMEWGTENEALAVDAYQNIKARNVSAVGFVTLGKHTGTSPDGYTEGGGLIEIKCPFNRLNHLQNIVNLTSADDLKRHSKQYYYQVQHQMYITGRPWCDFVSFDPRLLEGDNWRHCAHIIRIEPSDEVHANFKAKIEAGALYLESIINGLNV